MRQLVEWSGAVTMNEAYSSAVAVGRSSFGVIYVLVAFYMQRWGGSAGVGVRLAGAWHNLSLVTLAASVTALY